MKFPYNIYRIILQILTVLLSIFAVYYSNIGYNIGFYFFCISIFVALITIFIIVEYSIFKSVLVIFIGGSLSLFVGYLLGIAYTHFNHFPDGPGMSPNFSKEFIPIIYAYCGLIFGLLISANVIKKIRLRNMNVNQ